MEFDQLPHFMWGHTIFEGFYSHRGMGIMVVVLAWILYGMSFYNSITDMGIISSGVTDGLNEPGYVVSLMLLASLMVLVTCPFLITRFMMRYEDGERTKADEHREETTTDATEGEHSCDTQGKGSMENQPGHSQSAPTVVTNTKRDRSTSLDGKLYDGQICGDQRTLRDFPSPFRNAASLHTSTHPGYRGNSKSDMAVESPSSQRRIILLDKIITTQVPLSDSKAVNTFHQRMPCTRSICTETTGPYKKKLRRAQKLLKESLGKAREERKIRAEMWQRVLEKYHDKVLKLLRSSHGKSTLMAYVRTTNQSSEKDLHGEAVALSDLKWKLQYQCQLNEKFAEDMRNKRTLVNSLTQIIKSENEKCSSSCN